VFDPQIFPAVAVDKALLVGYRIGSSAVVLLPVLLQRVELVLEFGLA
jgi:hypothetical protein